MSSEAGRYWYALMVKLGSEIRALVIVSWSFANIVKDGKAEGEEKCGVKNL
jgi:hypothetical protein